MDSIIKLHFILVIISGAYGIRQVRRINSNMMNYQINSNLLNRKSQMSPSQAIYNDYFWDQNQSIYVGDNQFINMKYEPIQQITTPSSNFLKHVTPTLNYDLDWLCKTYKFCKNNQSMNKQKQKKFLCHKETEKRPNFVDYTTHRMFDLNEFMDKLTLPNIVFQPNFENNFTVEYDLKRNKREVDFDEMDPLVDTKKIRPLKLFSKFKFPRTAHLNFHPQVINMHKQQLMSESVDSEIQDAQFLPSSFKETIEPYVNNKYKPKTTTIQPPPAHVKIMHTPPTMQQPFVQPFFLPIIDDVVQYRV